MDYILTDDADVIIGVIDASNIERNLYLTAALGDGQGVVIALNMVDEAEKRQIAFDLRRWPPSAFSGSRSPVETTGLIDHPGGQGDRQEGQLYDPLTW